MKSPAFQFYPTDWLGSQRCQMLSLEEEGAYIRLLCFCWQHGSSPADPEQAARLKGKGGSTTLARVVLAMFQQSSDPTRLVHDRLEAERAKQSVWREKSAAGGRKSAEKRKGGLTTLQPPLEGCLPNGTNQKATLRLPSTSSVSNTIHAPAAADAGAEPDCPHDEPKRDVPRRPLNDALASLNGEDLSQITEPGWIKAAKALKQIKVVCPDVTVEEIQRRATNYSLKWPGKLTALALAAHWAEYDKRPAMLNFGEQPSQPVRMNIVKVP